MDTVQKSSNSDWTVSLPLALYGYETYFPILKEERRFRIYTYLLTELSPSWGAINCTATQELPSILWNPKVHVRKSPPLVPILSHINPVHTSHPISLRSILILSTHLCLGLASGLFLSRFPTSILYAFCLYFKTQRLGDWILSPSSGKIYSDGSNKQS
jgi:hypothetical protein